MVPILNSPPRIRRPVLLETLKYICHRRLSIFSTMQPPPEGDHYTTREHSSGHPLSSHPLSSALPGIAELPESQETPEPGLQTTPYARQALCQEGFHCAPPFSA